MSEQSLPVFVFPNQLVFVLRESSTHRQIMTIYNPYDFPVFYQVLCTSSNDYSVLEPEGMLKPRCCVDIAIRRIELRRTSEDKFRVILKRRDRADVYGHRDVPSIVLERHHETESVSSTMGASGDFRGFSLGAAASGSVGERQIVGHPVYTHSLSPTGRSGRSNVLLVFVALACIACLSAPASEDSSTSQTASSMYFPGWFHIGMSQKLVAAYVLGLITAAFLQS